MNRDNRNYGNEYIDFWKMMSKKLIENFNSETLYGQLVKEITMKQKASKALETVMLEEIVKKMKLPDCGKYSFGRDRECIVFQNRYTFDYDVCYDTEVDAIDEACSVLRKAIGNSKLRKLNMMFDGNSFCYSVFVEPEKNHTISNISRTWLERMCKIEEDKNRFESKEQICCRMIWKIYGSLDIKENEDIHSCYIGEIKHVGDVIGMDEDDIPEDRIGFRKLHGMQIREAIMLADPTYNKIDKTVSEIIGTIKTKFPNKWKYFAGNFVYDENMKHWLFCYQVEEYPVEKPLDIEDSKLQNPEFWNLVEDMWSTATEKPEPSFTIAEIEKYLDGNIMTGTGSANFALSNAITELKDKNNGIKAVTDRN